MKILLAGFFSLILLVGCEKIEGQLNITKDLKLVNSKGVTHLLKVGTYSADLTEKNSKKIILRLNNDSDEKFIFNHNGNIPENGVFEINSNISGQPVNLNGDVSTVVKNSEIKQSYESCQYQVNIQICRETPRGRMCTIESRIIVGNQWISYYDAVTNKNINIFVKAVNAPDESADFHGNASYLERVIVSKSQCR